MELKSVKDYCLTKTGAYEDYPFGPEPLVIKVQSKIFVLFNENGNKTSISLKCDPFVAQNLRDQYKAISPGYHLNKEHWNTVILDGSVPDSEIQWMINHSYELVVKGLPKSEKACLSANT